MTFLRLPRRAWARSSASLAVAGAIACGSGGTSHEHASTDTGADATAEAPSPDAGLDAPAEATVSGAHDAALDASDASDTASGRCVLDGGAQGLLCQGACTDVMNDPAQCGGCGAAHACPAGAVCGAGACENVAGSLSGLRWDLPCTGPSNGVSCPSEPDGGTSVTVSTTLSGAAGAHYDVGLRFRGVVEQRTYVGFDAGGAIGAEAEGGVDPSFFVAGGATPSLADTFNIYELDISDPPQTYYLNSGKSGINRVWLVDYLASIPMNAGATITLTANTVEGKQTAVTAVKSAP
jgi:hypothetical protein